MEVSSFITMLNDKHLFNFEKMKYKYDSDFSEFLQTLDNFYYKYLPLTDFNDNKIVFMENHSSLNAKAIKMLLKERDNNYGIRAAEDEIISTNAIESIEFSRNSVRNILKGLAPKDEEENRISGIKKGFEFIADVSNKINEENLYRLYMMTVGDFLSEENQLPKGKFYRDGEVFIVSDRIEHSGLDYKKIPQFMASLIEFINRDEGINDLIKAAVIHFYIAYIHPYFDGNGRMARLIHLWFLIQKGYRSALFIPFSSQIAKNRKAYYDSFTAVENNKKYGGKIDVTPFIAYFTENVYNKITENTHDADTFSIYEEALNDGKITEKEKNLWQFVLSYYGDGEFSTKQLEKDFGDAAYATIHTFVLKFKDMGLLSCTKYKNRNKYKITKTQL